MKFKNECQYIRGAELELTPPQLRSYVIEGVSILLPHPVIHYDVKMLLYVHLLINSCVASSVCISEY